MELSNEQRRQLIDAKQVFCAWREADREFRHSYRGSMRWKQVNGVDYLYRTYGSVKKSNGPRSEKTERIKHDYTEQRTSLRQRTTRLKNRLKQMDQVNRAYMLGRVPETASRILRTLDEEGLLGNHLFVVGTHCLFAYEARSGLLFDSGLTATGDIDLLWDARRKLTLALADVRREGVIGLLRRVDRTFHARPNSFRAINDDGYYVDLIRPMERNEPIIKVAKTVGVAGDLEAAAIVGLHWLLNTPKFEEVAIGADGRPVMINCVDPRVFALHKHWMSRREDREPKKRRRDAAQAKAVARVAIEYLNLPFQAKELTALPVELIQGAKELVRATRQRANRAD